MGTGNPNLTWPDGPISRPFITVGGLWLRDAVDQLEAVLYPNAASAVPTLSELQASLVLRVDMHRMGRISAGLRSEPASLEAVSAAKRTDEAYQQRLAHAKVRRFRVCSFLRAVFEADRAWRLPAFFSKNDWPVARDRWRDTDFFHYAMSRGGSNRSGEGALYVRRVDYQDLLGTMRSIEELRGLLPTDATDEQVNNRTAIVAASPSVGARDSIQEVVKFTPSEQAAVEAADSVEEWVGRKLPEGIRPNQIYKRVADKMGKNSVDRKIVRQGMKKAGYDWPRGR